MAIDGGTPNPGSFIAQALAMGNGGGSIRSASQLTSGSRSNDPYAGFVWMGLRKDIKPVPTSVGMTDLAFKVASMRTPVSAQQAGYLPYTWSEKERAKAYARVGEALNTKITSFSQFLNAWDQAVNIAQNSWAATRGGKDGSPLTPWDVFDMMKREGDKYGFGGQQSLARTVTATNKSITQLSDGGAWAILKNAARDALGRNPTHEELRQFAAKANSIAVNNPTVTTTTSHYNARGDLTSSNSKTKQGAGAEDFQMAAEKKVDTAEAGAYQAATTYYNALLNGLNSVV